VRSLWLSVRVSKYPPALPRASAWRVEAPAYPVQGGWVGDSQRVRRLCIQPLAPYAGGEVIGFLCMPCTHTQQPHAMAVAAAMRGGGYLAAFAITPHLGCIPACFVRRGVCPCRRFPYPFPTLSAYPPPLVSRRYARGKWVGSRQGGCESAPYPPLPILQRGSPSLVGFPPVFLFVSGLPKPCPMSYTGCVLSFWLSIPPPP